MQAGGKSVTNNITDSEPVHPQRFHSGQTKSTTRKRRIKAS